jgi:hypothetical protein
MCLREFRIGPDIGLALQSAQLSTLMLIRCRRFQLAAEHVYIGRTAVVCLRRSFEPAYEWSGYSLSDSGFSPCARALSARFRAVVRLLAVSILICATTLLQTGRLVHTLESGGLGHPLSTILWVQPVRFPPPSHPVMSMNRLTDRIITNTLD